MEELIYFGGAVKATKIGEHLTELSGPAVVFDDDAGEGHDLVKEYFSSKSFFGPSVAPEREAEFEATFNHGLVKQEELKPLADHEFKNPVKVTVGDVGLMAKLILDERDEYEAMLADLGRQGKLGWSTGTAAHRAKREKKADGRTWIKRWPIVEVAVTHKPCEPRTSAIPLKSFLEELDGAAKAVDGERLFTESLRQTEQQTWELWSAVQTGSRKIAEAAAMSDVTGAAVDVRQAVTSLVGAYSPKLIEAIVSQINDYLSAETRDEHFYLKSTIVDEFIASGSGLVSGSDLEGHSQAVVSAVAEFAKGAGALAGPLKAWLSRLKDKQEFRATKDGRVISRANRERVGEVMAQIEALVPVLKEMHGALGELHAMGEPKAEKSADPDVVRGLLANFEFMQRRTNAARSN